MIRLAAAGLTVALLGAACAGPNPDASSEGKVDETTTTTIAKGPDTTAAQLRSKLTGLLQEHVYLAAAASGAIVGGRSDEVAAASAALDGNSQALADNVTAIFAGTQPDATTAKQFGDLWRRHVGYVVAYAQGSCLCRERPRPVRQGLRRLHQLVTAEPAGRSSHEPGDDPRTGTSGRGRRTEGQGRTPRPTRPCGTRPPTWRPWVPA